MLTACGFHRHIFNYAGAPVHVAEECRRFVFVEELQEHGYFTSYKVGWVPESSQIFRGRVLGVSVPRSDWNPCPSSRRSTSVTSAVRPFCCQVNSRAEVLQKPGGQHRCGGASNSAGGRPCQVSAKECGLVLLMLLPAEHQRGSPLCGASCALPLSPGSAEA